MDWGPNHSVQKELLRQDLQNHLTLVIKELQRMFPVAMGGRRGDYTLKIMTQLSDYVDRVCNSAKDFKEADEQLFLGLRTKHRRDIWKDNVYDFLLDMLQEGKEWENVPGGLFGEDSREDIIKQTIIDLVLYKRPIQPYEQQLKHDNDDPNEIMSRPPREHKLDVSSDGEDDYLVFNST